MGNCISKISKERLFVLEEFMKNKTSFEKEMARSGGTYMSIHSIKGFSRKEMFAPLQTGMWWTDLH